MLFRSNELSTLVGGEGDDTLVVLENTWGATVRGGRGGDLYRIWTTATYPTFIEDTDPGVTQDDAIDMVEFAPGVRSDGVVFERADNPYDLLVGQSGAGHFTVKGYFAPDDMQDGIELFLFEDGSVLTPQQITAMRTTYGTQGDDVLAIAAGSSGDLLGLGGTDVLTGGSGNDLLDGGAGADTMSGQAGNDLYSVDNIGDVIIEAAAGGTDTVNSSISYTLGSEVEDLTLVGTANIDATGNNDDNTLIGNNGANVLIGGTGHDVLRGRSGADTMIGGAGSDTYQVDDAGDQVIDIADGYSNRVEASISYTLLDNVNELTLLEGTAAVSGTGNVLNNEIRGNSLDNLIDGGAGADNMYGGEGNDTYWVDTVDDMIYEEVNSGTDTVKASISYALTYLNEVENVTLLGGASITATGNAKNNVLIGNAGSNPVLDRKSVV